MIETMKVFDDPSLMEPRCSSCNSIIKIGKTTKFDDKKQDHVCLGCGEVVR